MAERNEFQHDIHGGLNLDSDLNSIKSECLTDSLNLSHNSDDRNTGILNPCIGVKPVNCVWRTLTPAEDPGTIHHLDGLTVETASGTLVVSPLINPTAIEESRTDFYLVEKNPDLGDAVEEYTCDAPYVATLLLRAPIDKFPIFTQDWQAAHHTYNSVTQVFLVRKGEAPYLFIFGKDARPTLYRWNMTEIQDSDFPRIQIEGFVSGQLSHAQPSQSFYTYVAEYTNGQYSLFANISEPVMIPYEYPRDFNSYPKAGPLAKDWRTPDETALYDDPKAIKSRMMIRLGLDLRESHLENVAYILFFAVRIQDADGQVRLDCIDRVPYKKFIYTMDGAKYVPTPVDAAQWRIMTPLKVANRLTLGAVHIKDDVLYGGDSQYIPIAQSASYDARVWQFTNYPYSDEDPEPVIEALDWDLKGYKYDDLIAADPATLPELWYQAMAKNGQDSAIWDPTTQSLYVKDGSAFGAEGPNVKLEFVTGEMDYGGVYADRDDDATALDWVNDQGSPTLHQPEYNFSPGMRKISPSTPTCGLPGSQLGSGWLSQNTIGQHKAHKHINIGGEAVAFTDDARNGGHSFANPVFSARFKCMQHDSVYRLACILTLDTGEETEPIFMGDVRTPSMNAPGFHLFDHHVNAMDAAKQDYPTSVEDETYSCAQHVEVRFRPIYLKCTFSNLPDNVVSVRTVYAKREEQSRNVLATGVVTRTNSPLEADSARNDFLRNADKYCLPPLPTIGRTVYYFGGINSMGDLDWSNTMPNRTDTEKGNKKALHRSGASYDWLHHNVPYCWNFQQTIDKSSHDLTMGLESVKYNRGLLNAYYSMGVEINNEYSSRGRPSWLFFAPELDFTPNNSKPLFPSIGASDGTAAAICFHYGLSSLMPAREDRRYLSVCSTDANRNLESIVPRRYRFKSTMEYSSMNPNNFQPLAAENNYDGILWNFRHPAQDVTAKGLIATTNITGYFRTAWKDTQPESKSEVENMAKADEKKDHSSIWGKVVNITMATGAAVAAVAQLGLNPAADAGAAMLWGGVISDIVKGESHRDLNQEEIAQISRSYTTEFSYVSAAPETKTLKFLIPWKTYGTAKEYSVLLGSNMEDQQFIQNTNIVSPSDQFHYLFPCTYNAYHPGTGNTPNPFPVYTSHQLNYVNISPLWSGEYNPSSKDVVGFANNFYINQMSCMNRNHIRCIYWATGSGANDTRIELPCYWGNRDAAQYPFSDHGQVMQMAPDDVAGLIVRRQENFPSTAITQCRGGGGENSYENHHVDYQVGQLPKKSSLLFPAAMWYPVNPPTADAPFVMMQDRYMDWYNEYNACGFDYIKDPAYMPQVAILKSAWAKAFMSETNNDTHNYGNGMISVNYSSGLNFTGYGGNALLFNLPQDVEDKVCGSDYDTFALYCEDASRTTDAWDRANLLDDLSTCTPKTGADRWIVGMMSDALDRGVHVLLATLRNKVNPFEAVPMETVQWVECARYEVAQVDEKTHTCEFIATGFDTYLGVHDRTYLNAFYPGGGTVRGEASSSGSAPIDMLFPYEGPINLEISSNASSLHDPANPGETGAAPRTGPFISDWNIGNEGARRYRQETKDYAYNTSYSYAPVVTDMFVKDKRLIDEVAFPNRIYYAPFDFAFGQFPPFGAPGTGSMDLDRRYGDITRIGGREIELLIFQQSAVAVAQPSARTLVQPKKAEDNRNIYLASEGLLSDRYRYLTTTFGCSPECVPGETASALYWVDVRHAGIFAYGSGRLMNIGATGNVTSFLKAYGRTANPACFIHRMRDGNVRFRFSDDPYAGRTVFLHNAERRVLEWNEAVGCFASFIEQGSWDPAAGGFFRDGMVFMDGDYDAMAPNWMFDDPLLPVPAYEVYVNPLNDFSDKVFYAVKLQEYTPRAINGMMSVSAFYNGERTPIHAPWDLSKSLNQYGQGGALPLGADLWPDQSGRALVAKGIFVTFAVKEWEKVPMSERKKYYFLPWKISWDQLK